ncbi:hypothetical protein [Neisseria sp. Ec49-e6-T10]|uniref:hypothetical protein n=1 Tax=Neisseria sp. Ec49-e6-T10 TaxID=3140744 RepID=UPI003EB90773
MKQWFNFLKYILVVLFILLSQISCKSISSESPPSNLSSVWKGAAYQFDVSESWDIVVSFDQTKQQTVIKYPSLNCGGYWSLLDSDEEMFEFREVITEGQNECTNNGRVVLKKKDDVTFEFYYFWPDDQTFSAYGLVFKR